MHSPKGDGAHRSFLNRESELSYFQALQIFCLLTVVKIKVFIVVIQLLDLIQLFEIP